MGAKHSRTVLAGICLVASGVAACAAILGVDHEYTEGVAEAGTPSDAGPDAEDASSPSFQCGAARVSSCLGCSAGGFACAATAECVATCSTDCPGAPVECQACDPSGAVTRAQCEPKETASACTALPNRSCGCDAAVNCPGARQTCVERECKACGESGTNGQKCAAGKNCHSDDAGPPQDDTTCR